MVECAGLENQSPREGTVSSNLTLSASKAENMKFYYTYILHSIEHKRLYVGSTEDFVNRLLSIT